MNLEEAEYYLRGIDLVLQGTAPDEHMWATIYNSFTSCPVSSHSIEAKFQSFLQGIRDSLNQTPMTVSQWMSIREELEECLKLKNAKSTSSPKWMSDATVRRTPNWGADFSPRFSDQYFTVAATEAINQTVSELPDSDVREEHQAAVVNAIEQMRQRANAALHPEGTDTVQAQGRINTIQGGVGVTFSPEEMASLNQFIGASINERTLHELSQVTGLNVTQGSRIGAVRLEVPNPPPGEVSDT